MSNDVKLHIYIHRHLSAQMTGQKSAFYNTFIFLCKAFDLTRKVWYFYQFPILCKYRGFSAVIHRSLLILCLFPHKCGLNGFQVQNKRISYFINKKWSLMKLAKWAKPSSLFDADFSKFSDKKKKNSKVLLIIIRVVKCIVLTYKMLLQWQNGDIRISSAKV